MKICFHPILTEGKALTVLRLLLGFIISGPVLAEVKVHDPSSIVMEEGGSYFVSTGMGISLMERMGDGWKQTDTIFHEGKYPAWHADLVPANKGHLWAPDIIRMKDSWWIFYSVSSFGKNTSAIGLVSGKSLDPTSDDYGWKDEGVVIRSGEDDGFNAIDPALILEEGRLWMSFGSFWDGIMLVELNPITGQMKDPAANPLLLAANPQIEAPYIHAHEGWFYLFVNWGFCCRGVNSTYEIRIGRSRSVSGPYLDQDRIKMTDGGGSILLGTEGRRIGPGHASIFHRSGKPYLGFHYYDRENHGKARFGSLPIRWQDGWPVLGK